MPLRAKRVNILGPGLASRWRRRTASSRAERSSRRFPPDGANRGHYRNPPKEALTDQTRVGINLEKRKALSNEVPKNPCRRSPYGSTMSSRSSDAVSARRSFLPRRLAPCSQDCIPTWRTIRQRGERVPLVAPNQVPIAALASNPSPSSLCQSRGLQSRLPFQSSTRPHSTPRSSTAASLRSRRRPKPAAHANPIASSPAPRLHTKKIPKCSRSFPSPAPRTLELGSEPPRSAASATPPDPFLPSPSTESCARHSPPASAHPARTSAPAA